MLRLLLKNNYDVWYTVITFYEEKKSRNLVDSNQCGKPKPTSI